MQPVWQWVLSRWESAAVPPIAVTYCVAVITFVLCLTRRTWPAMRYVATTVHELGHAGAAFLTGRRVSGMEIRGQSAGATFTRGKTGGVGAFLVRIAGYLAPCVVGTALVWAALAGYSGAALLLLGFTYLVALILVLVSMNLRGILVVGLQTVALAALAWFNNATLTSTVMIAVALFLVFAGTKCAWELGRDHRRGNGSGSDADQLRHQTHLPAMLWVGWFLTVGVAGIVTALALPILHR